MMMKMTVPSLKWDTSVFNSWNTPHVGSQSSLSWHRDPALTRTRLTLTRVRPDLPKAPNPELSWSKEPGPSCCPPISEVQGSSRTPWGLCLPYPSSRPNGLAGQVGRRVLCGQDLQPGRPSSWCSGGRHVKSVPLYGQLSLIVIVCLLRAQQTSRGDTPSTRAARSPATRPIRTVN